MVTLHRRLDAFHFSVLLKLPLNNLPAYRVGLVLQYHCGGRHGDGTTQASIIDLSTGDQIFSRNEDSPRQTLDVDFAITIRVVGNAMEMDGYSVIIRYDPRLRMLRGELVSFHAVVVFSLKTSQVWKGEA